MQGIPQILLIELARDAQRITRGMHEAGFQFKVRQAETLDDFKNCLQSFKWDVLIANPHLAECPMTSVLKLIDEQGTDSPTILLGQTIDPDWLSHYFGLGASQYISKTDIRLLPLITRRTLLQHDDFVRRQKQQSALSTWLHRFRMMTELSPLAAVVIQNLKISYLNPSARSILGIEQTDSLQQEALADIRGALLSAIASRRQQSEDEPFSARLIRLDGSSFSAEIRFQHKPLHGQKNLFIIFKQIKQNGETILPDQLTMFMPEIIRQALFATDQHGKIISINSAFTELTGYHDADIIGKSQRLLHHQDLGPESHINLWNKLLEDGNWQGEINLCKQSGDVFPAWLSIVMTKQADDSGPFTVGVFTDITKTKQSQSELEHMAHHDPLTGLPNRLLFESRLEHAINQAKRHRNHLAVLFIDLDRFKNINDSLGHAVGDELLIQVAYRLKKALRGNDTAARLGGDEFTVLGENLQNPNYSAVVARKILDQFSQPYVISGHKLHITASIGISIFPDDGQSVSDLTKNADAAMYQAKESGRNKYRYYTAELTKDAFERLLIENELRTAIAEHQLLLYYQPQFDLKEDRVIGAEVLMRWQHPRLGLLKPDRFIPLAEDTGLIYELGLWSLEQVCHQALRWSQLGLFNGRLAVNLSAHQIMQTDLILNFEKLIEQTGCQPDQLQFEVTESIFLGHQEFSIPVLDVFKRLGVTIAIDDFGTGFSSLSYLRQLPIDKLKIDRSFITDLPDDEDAVAITKAIISMGKTLGMRVIAEGIETEAQYDLLKSLDCDEAQGYLFGMPLTEEQFEERLISKYTIWRPSMGGRH